jgi:hypothetical protein
MNELIRRIAFLAAYIGLAVIVTFGSFWVRHQFKAAHEDRCQIAVQFVRLIEASVIQLAPNQRTDPNAVNLINEAIHDLNARCDLDLKELPK